MAKKSVKRGKKLLKVVVDRSKWLRGGADAFLLSKEEETKGLMCCMGFAARAAGFKRKDILDVPIINDIPKVYDDETKGCPISLTAFGKDQTKAASEVYDTNDSKRLTDFQREAKLKRLGKKTGINFIFTGPKGYPKKLAQYYASQE